MGKAILKSVTWMILMTAVIIIVPGCIRNGADSSRVSEEQCVMGCWINENIYRIHATAIPSATAVGKEDRRLTAKREAVITACRLILMKFKGMILELAGHILPSGTSAEENANKVRETVDNGKVIQEWYDDEDNCEVLYEVKRTGIRNMVYNSTLYRD